VVDASASLLSLAQRFSLVGVDCCCKKWLFGVTALSACLQYSGDMM